MNIHRKDFGTNVTLYYAAIADDATAQLIAADPRYGPLFEGITSPSRRRERASEIIMLDAIAGGRGFEFSHTPVGSPMLSVGGVKHHISVSHSRTELAMAISTVVQPGVDIENMRAQLMKVTSRFLNSGEIDFWMRTPERLLQAWSAKEAAFKAWSPQVGGLSAITLAMAADGSVTADAPFQHTLRIEFITWQAPLRCIALALPAHEVT